MKNNSYRKCTCEHCNNDSNNYKIFLRYNNKWYCRKHYNQLINHGEIIDYKPCKNGEINDMYFGWTTENETNKRIAFTWHNMFKRCYDEEWLKKYPSYNGCYVCDKWWNLSGFIEDIVLIDGYDYWVKHPNERIVLDKDIKSNGNNKCYCLEECMFVSQSENGKQAMKTRDYSKTSGKNSSSARSVIQYDMDMNFIKVWDTAKEASKKLGVNSGCICLCCQHKINYAKDKNGNKFKWEYKE